MRPSKLAKTPPAPNAENISTTIPNVFKYIEKKGRGILEGREEGRKEGTSVSGRCINLPEVTQC